MTINKEKLNYKLSIQYRSTIILLSYKRYSCQYHVTNVNTTYETSYQY